jgi:pre-mRNA-processing factor SLU7
MKVTARNLRIRENTAKYLRNLDLNSAYYDPKSRSMRDNPYPETNQGEVPFAGDNFTRISGDAVGLVETQVFCWDAAEKGLEELHPQANPSQAELLKKQFKERSTTVQQKKKRVVDTYGGSEYFDGSSGLADSSLNLADNGDGNPVGVSFRQDRKVRFGAAFCMEEYTRDGRLLLP